MLFVLTTITREVVPGRIFAESVGLKLNPTVFAAAFRSAVTGALVPATKTPPGRLAPSVRKPVKVTKPVNFTTVTRAIAVAEVGSFATW